MYICLCPYELLFSVLKKSKGSSSNTGLNIRCEITSSETPLVYTEIIPPKEYASLRYYSVNTFTNYRHQVSFI